jgi:hypothetical protein
MAGGRGSLLVTQELADKAGPIFPPHRLLDEAAVHQLPGLGNDSDELADDYLRLCAVDERLHMAPSIEWFVANTTSFLNTAI